MNNDIQKRRCRFALQGSSLWLVLWIVSVMAWISPADAADSPPEPEVRVLKNIGEIHSITPDETGQDRFIKIQAVVTYNDPAWNLFYCQDETDSLYVPPFPGQEQAKVGDRVEITSRVTLEDGGLTISHTKIKVLGHGRLPKPRRVAGKELLVNNSPGKWLEVQGEVRMAMKEDRQILVLMMDGERFRVLILDTKEEDINSLLGATVRVCGACAGRPSSQDPSSHPVDLFVPGMSQITVVTPARENSSKIPVSPIMTLMKLVSNPRKTPARVHLHGVIMKCFEDSVILEDATGRIKVQTPQAGSWNLGERVSVQGIPSISTGELVVEDGMIESTQPQEKAPATITNSAPVLNLPEMTSIGDIVKLAPEEAAKGYPVRIKGVAVYSDPEWSMLFVQSQTGAIYVDKGTNNPHVETGDEVEIEGATISGIFQPSISKATIRVLGKGTMPPVRKVSHAELLTGAYDCQWVELEGIVQDFANNWGHVVFKLAVGTAQFEIMVPGFTPRAKPTNYIGDKLQVRGACAMQPNQSGQIKSLLLHVPSTNHMIILEAAASDPFSLPTRRVRDLLRFRPQEFIGRRTKLQGVVTLLRPGSVCLQDETGGIMAEIGRRNSLQVGQLVEVVGFPEAGPFSPRLQNAVVRVSGSGIAPSPSPAKVTAEQILARTTNDMELVEIEARLLEDVKQNKLTQMILQEGGVTFIASKAMVARNEPDRLLRGGSLLRLTGVCVIQASMWGQPRSFHILLRSPQDIVLLKSPPRFTLRNMFAAMGALGVIIVAVSVWIITLRRRVRQQTELVCQKLTQEAALEERYRDLFENASDVIFAIDFSGKWLSLNNAAKRIFNNGKDEFPTQTAFDFIIPEYQDCFRAVIQRIREGASTVTEEVQIFDHEQSLVILEVGSRLLTQNGSPIGLECIARNVTERKQAEEKLRLLQFGVDHATDCLFWLAPNGRFIYVNEAACRRLEYTAEELLQKCYYEVDLALSGESWSAFWTRLKNDSTPAFKSSYCTKNKRAFPVEITGKYLQYHHEEFGCLVARDITDREQLEGQLRQAQKMEAVGQLAGGVAHDFNNILSVFIMHLHMLKSDFDLPQEAVGRLGEVEKEAERATKLTRQLLMFSRRQAMQFKKLDLNQLLLNLSTMLQRLLGEHIAIQLSLAHQSMFIEADAGMIDQVIMNLSVNARDAMPRKGRLFIGTCLSQIDAKSASANPEARPGSFVCLSVSDTGCGMDQATLKRIFEPFFTTKEVGKGTGLGLATVYGIVKQHKGWIEVESTPDIGTKFTIYLPACSEEISAAPTDVVQRPVGGTETILLVEDEPAVRLTVKMCLKRYGYNVLEAANGAEALSIWSKQQSEIHLLFTDVVMPEGMSGLELAEKLKSQKTSLKVIVGSGYSGEIIKTGVPNQPGMVFLGKPYEPEPMLLAIRKVLNQENLES